LAIFLSCCIGEGEDLLLTHGDYYLPSRLLKGGRGEMITVHKKYLEIAEKDKLLYFLLFGISKKVTMYVIVEMKRK
jgi:hypothetical protein